MFGGCGFWGWLALLLGSFAARRWLFVGVGWFWSGKVVLWAVLEATMKTLESDLGCDKLQCCVCEPMRVR